MRKKYVVRLTDEERKTLQEMATKFKGSSQKVRQKGGGLPTSPSHNATFTIPLASARITEYA
jgi:hypothetical protein